VTLQSGKRMSPLLALVARAKDKLGPLGWGTLVVFMISRVGDMANVAYRFFLGRNLSELDFGAVAPIQSVLVLLALPVTIVFQVAVKSISRLRATGRTEECRSILIDLVRFALVGSVLSGAGLWFARGYILRRLHLSSEAYFYPMVIMFVLAWWKPLYRAILQATRRYRLLLLPSVLNPFILLGATLFFVGVLCLGLWGALMANALAGVLTLSAVMVMLLPLFKGPRRAYRDELPVILGMVPAMVVFTAGQALLTHFDRLFVRNFLLAESGGFGALVTLGMIPSYLLAAITFVVFPLASAEHANHRDLGRFRRQVVLWGFVITGGCVCGSALLAEPIMRLWNPVFLPYARYVWAYSAAVGLYGTAGALARVEMARHRYGFLWSLVLPAVASCAWLYTRREVADLNEVVSVVLLTRCLVFCGVWLYSLRGERTERG